MLHYLPSLFHYKTQIWCNLIFQGEKLTIKNFLECILNLDLTFKSFSHQKWSLKPRGIKYHHILTSKLQNKIATNSWNLKVGTDMFKILVSKAIVSV